MKFRRRLTGLSLALGVAATIGLGMSGAAEATVVDPAGLEHIYGFGTEQCVLADSASSTAQAWRCENTGTEQWTEVPVQEAGQPFYLFVSHWTNTCLAEGSPRPVDGTPVVLKPCDVHDVTQFWAKQYDSGAKNSDATVYRLHSLLGDLCLDRPSQSTANGNRFQTWTCHPPEWIFSDPHTEQTMRFTAKIS